MNAELFEELRTRQPERPRPTRTGAILMLASLALLVFDVGLLVVGGYLIAVGIVPLKVLGGFLILVGLECRIRFPKAQTGYNRVSRDEAPALFEIIDEAQRAVGAPRIDTVQVDTEFNATCGYYGIRRRPVLTLGLPLWSALGPAARQALLGHELGHLVNGDVRARFLTQPAVTTLGHLAIIFDPRPLAGGRTFRSNVFSEVLAAILAYAIFAPAQFVFLAGHNALLRVAARDHQRAEVYADALAVRLGGSAGAEELMRVLVLLRRVAPRVRKASRTFGPRPELWRGEVAAVTELPAAELTVQEQLSLRYDADIYASHPPSGMRRRLVRSWTERGPAYPVPEAAHAAADEQLQRRYERVTKQLAR
jgi:Zn-dependent protease with chaperone function